MTKHRKALSRQSASRSAAVIIDAACGLEQLELPGVLAAESTRIQADHDSPSVTQADSTVTSMAEMPASVIYSETTVTTQDNEQDFSFTSPATSTITELAAKVVPPLKVTVGAQLQKAREQQALSREEIARRLRVPPAIIGNIETEQWEKLGASIYVRGHLLNYARALQLPLDSFEGVLHTFAEPAPLTLAVAAEPAAPWFTRHARTMSYVVLTLLLAVPVLTLIPKRGVNSPVPLVRLTSEVNFANNTSPSIAQDISVAGTLVEDSGLPLAEKVGLDSSVRSFANPSSLTAPPLMASMAPLAEVLQRSAPVPRQHRLRFTLSADSWVEVIDAQGIRLEYGMLRTGEVREHTVEGTTTVNFGNASGVAFSVDDIAFDLMPHTRLNVARVRLFDSPSATSSAPR